LHIDNRKGNAVEIKVGQAVLQAVGDWADEYEVVMPEMSASSQVTIGGKQVGKLWESDDDIPKEPYENGILIDVSGRHAYREETAVYVDMFYANMPGTASSGKPKKPHVVFMSHIHHFDRPIDYFFRPFPSAISATQGNVKMRIDDDGF
jgi:hypothetical protein